MTSRALEQAEQDIGTLQQALANLESWQNQLNKATFPGGEHRAIAAGISQAVTSLQEALQRAKNWQSHLARQMNELQGRGVDPEVAGRMVDEGIINLPPPAR